MSITVWLTAAPFYSRGKTDLFLSEDLSKHNNSPIHAHFSQSVLMTLMDIPLARVVLLACLGVVFSFF